MLMTGPFRYSRPAQRLSKPLAVGHSPYLEYKSSGTPQPEMLFVKRHSKSGFMVSNYSKNTKEGHYSYADCICLLY